MEEDEEAKSKEAVRQARRQEAIQNLVNHGFAAAAGGDVWFKLGEVFLLKETAVGEWEIVAL